MITIKIYEDITQAEFDKAEVIYKYKLDRFQEQLQINIPKYNGVQIALMGKTDRAFFEMQIRVQPKLSIMINSIFNIYNNFGVGATTPDDLLSYVLPDGSVDTTKILFHSKDTKDIKSSYKNAATLFIGLKEKIEQSTSASIGTYFNHTGVDLMLDPGFLATSTITWINKFWDNLDEHRLQFLQQELNFSDTQMKLYKRDLPENTNVASDEIEKDSE